MPRTRNQTFSEYFDLGKSQYELDFVDIPVNNGDIPLFLDPYAISKRLDSWSIHCHNSIVAFFQGVVDKIRENNAEVANYMLSGLREPNQTRFGLSIGQTPRGRGVGGEQATQLYSALAESSAVRTGFIKDLEDCELLIEGIGRDKISDITTNIIRGSLIEYTQHQCSLWGITMHEVPGGMIWDQQTERWGSAYTNLPICNERSVILVPKAIARFSLEFNHQEYYQHFVLNFLQAEYLQASSALVRVLRDGTRKGPTKKSLKLLYPISKKYLYEFSRNNPAVLRRYKESKTCGLNEISNELLSEINQQGDDIFDYDQLASDLDNITPGDADATKFHKHIKGVLTAIFYPFLINPEMEREIHDGRKRIDIIFQNAAQDGFFFELPTTKGVPSAYIPVECKNYTGDPANPALDQLSGRFSTNRGKFGFLICRTITNKSLFLNRCKDTANDDRGFIIALDDADIKELLRLRKANDNRAISAFFDQRYRSLIM